MNYLLTKVCLFLALFILFPVDAIAQLSPDNSLDSIVIAFRDVASNWVAPLIRIATFVFWTLVLIDFIITFGSLALEGATLEAYTAELMRRIIVVSFGAWLLLNPNLMVDVVNGFRESAGLATGHGAIRPTNIFDEGMKLVASVWDEFSIWDGDSWGLALVSIIILICMALIAAWMVVTLCEMYVVTSGGVILLGLLGARQTKEYGQRYLGYLISVGMKLFVIQILAGIGIALLQQWVVSVGNDTGTSGSGAIIYCGYFRCRRNDSLEVDESSRWCCSWCSGRCCWCSEWRGNGSERSYKVSWRSRAFWLGESWRNHE